MESKLFTGFAILLKLFSTQGRGLESNNNF